MAIITTYLVFSMLIVMWLDITRYTIPNWLSGSILALYPLGVYLAPVAVDWQSALIGMAIVFAAGYLLFIRKWMGGGDIKLIIACSLWVGMGQLVHFIFLLSVLGGIFAVALWGGRKCLHCLPVPIKAKSGALPRILQEGAPVPYGVAIAAAFLFMLWSGQMPAAGF